MDKSRLTDGGLTKMQRQAIINELRWAVVGDALGLPAENRERDTYSPITTMIASEYWQQPAGTWSDDTSMSLGMVENLVVDGDYDDLMCRFESYMRFGTDTPRGEMFDIGRTCAHAIRNFAINQLPAVQCGDCSVDANGNGALMRMAPLGTALQSDSSIAHRLTRIRRYTAVTHGHPRSIMASLIYCELLHALHQGQQLSKALIKVHQLLAMTIKAPALLNELNTYQPLFSSHFKQTSRADVRNTGYVVDTLLAACWLALNYETPRETVLAAANFGGDTDTIATIAASLAAAGHPAIPVATDWWQQILNRPLLDERFSAFATKYGD
ncbi:ADP-ribosylglycohydrolase family protein [Lactiplantibacillus pentosus]|uniref:ADP-ribosylglycohydrolase family protein n=2 Tax=Lactiplantibacillus pentosus TaxID=1589 RepID=A0AAW8W111_LACPE|nr:ADP-ribosylglycohydrolase family protein [Lactiplantibacillus pentosus]